MRQLVTILSVWTLVCVANASYAQAVSVAHFHKVIISPYIQATFIQGDQESVTVNSAIVDTSKLHVAVHGGALRVYLDGAKDIPHNHRDRSYGYHQSYHLYPDHAVIVTIVYKKLDELSLRGTEKYLSESPLTADKFTLHVYGESTMIFTKVHIAKMYAALYGESTLDIRSGDIDKQHYTCYGEGKVHTTTITGRTAKVTAFGQAEFAVNVSDRIKVTAFGEAKLRYMGNPDIVKGINIGDVDLQKID